MIIAVMQLVYVIEPLRVQYGINLPRVCFKKNQNCINSLNHIHGKIIKNAKRDNSCLHGQIDMPPSLS